MGTAFLKAMIPTTVAIVLCEASVHVPGLAWLNDTSAAGNLRQLPLLAAGAVLYAGLTLWAYHRSAVLYEKVDL